MALQSELFRGDTKLEAAAVSDPAHILSGAKGPHVGKIQLALILLDRADISQDSVYGPATAAAVRAFKQKRQILNFQGKIDDIVGKKTMAALDAEMVAKEKASEAGGRLGFKITDGDIPGTRPIADIVVRLDGAAVAGSMPTDDVFSPALVPPYRRMPVPAGVSKLGLFGRVLVRPDTGRLLLRVGRSTATTGAASFPLFVEVTSDLVTLLVGLGAAPGKIYIFGSSSGGRNTIDFAAHLTRLGFKPHLVAAVDAPFFQNETAIRPAANDDTKAPKTIPTFTMDAGSTPIGNRFNFFQTIGNHVKTSRNPLSSARFFTSGMKNEEIHGEIQGFQNINLNRFLTQSKDDDQAHEQCGNAGNDEARRRIAQDILGTT